MLRIKNWEKFQHFKNRRPPWIKLYRDLLDDIEWHSLPGDAAKVLVSLWLHASETGNPTLPGLKQLSFRLRMTEKRITDSISMLSHWLEQDDIKVISSRYQDDTPETERETERETEAEDGVSVSDKSIENLKPTFWVDEVIALWNLKAHKNLPRIQLVSKTRETHVKARLETFPRLDQWEHLISKINASPFLVGLKTEWKCDFDWVINPTNMAKILEGNYDDDRNRFGQNGSRFAKK